MNKMAPKYISFQKKEVYKNKIIFGFHFYKNYHLYKIVSL